MVLLTRNTSARACRVGMRQSQSGQQTRGRFISAVLNYSHCQLVVPHVKIVTRAHSCQVLTSQSSPLYSTHFMTCLHGDLLPPCFSHLSQRHSRQYLFNENTFSNFISFQKKGSGSRWGGEPQKMMRLGSLQVDPSIQSTKITAQIPSIEK